MANHFRSSERQGDDRLDSTSPRVPQADAVQGDGSHDPQSHVDAIVREEAVNARSAAAHAVPAAQTPADPAPQAPADAEPLQPVTTVTAPEALKGLTAVLADGQLSLKSRDQLLPAGDATDICPANCLPELLRTLAEGYLKEQGTEPLEDTPCLRLTLETTGQSGAAVLCSVWLDESSLIPRYAEFSQNGNVVLTVRMISFACTTGDTEA